MGMKVIWAVPVIASILILGTLGISYDAFAANGDNSGNKGCEKANPKSKVCEKNPNTEPPGNLIIFVNGDDIGFSGIECTVWKGMDSCPGGNIFSEVLFEGTTDQNGMLSFNIPQEEFPVVTVVCELAEVGGLAGQYYFVDVPTSTPFDFDIDGGTNDCCPTF